jgi:hypothetical protein
MCRKLKGRAAAIVKWIFLPRALLEAREWNFKMLVDGKLSPP